MLKILMKKQFLQMNTMYFIDRKTGKRRSAAGTAGYVILFAFLFLSLAMSFAGISALFSSAFLPAGLDWLYFAMFGMISVFLSSLVNMFSASSALFRAKDNELLLSLPIPPSDILVVRLLGLYGWGLLFDAIIFLPAVVTYWINKPVSAASVVMPLLVFLASSLLILALSSLFGWIVAAISSRLRSRAIITTLITLALIVVYYVVYFRMNMLLQSAVANADKLASVIRGKLMPFYHLGMGASGNIVSLLIYFAIAAGLCAAAVLVLSRSYVRIITTDRGVKKVEYKEKETKQLSVRNALVRRELRRFLTCPAYLMNQGMGLLVIPVLCIFLLIKREVVAGTVSGLLTAFPEGEILLPAALCAACCLMISMNCTAAPSVSLEGKYLWIVRSLPVSSQEVLDAKQLLNIRLNIVPAVLLCLVSKFVFGLDISVAADMLLFCLGFIILSAAAGVAADLKHANLNWTSETAAVKQGMGVVITLFGGWGVIIAFFAAAYFLRNTLSAETLLIAFFVLFAAAARLINGWIKTRGVQIFEEL